LTISSKSHTLKLSRIGCGDTDMAVREPTINLLPQNRESLLNQFLDWALTIGRLLVILTEMVALGTFIYRFGLDMQIVNLHDDIKSKSFIVDNFKDAETKFRDVQDRLATAKKYSAVSHTTTAIFTEISKFGQDKITFKDINVSTQDAKIVIEARSASAISQFVNGLKDDSSITTISIDKITNNTSSAEITVYLTATLKKALFAPPDQPTAKTVTNASLNP